MEELTTEKFEKCMLCPHECKANRIKGEIGRCQMTANVKIALADLHFYEEPCISGESGSGAIFFTGCNMKCLFCQNYEISQLNKGIDVTTDELADEFLKLQERGANNINLVTGCIWIPQIIDALKIAKENGLKIPVVYNSSGYEKVETLKMLEGYIDVYLPDLKYYYDELGKELSGVENYFKVATGAIKEMYRQVGYPQFDEKGIIKRGLIIRHLVLPNHIQNTRKVLEWIKRNIDNKVFVSIMAQYFPENKACDRCDINRKLSTEEYQKVEKIVGDLCIENGYMQELEDDEKKYVPKWNV